MTNAEPLVGTFMLLQYTGGICFGSREDEAHCRQVMRDSSCIEEVAHEWLGGGVEIVQEDNSVLVVVASRVDDYGVFPVEMGSARDQFLGEGVED